MSLSRAEVEAMDRDELIDAIVGLSQTVEDLQAEVDSLREDLKTETENRQSGLGKAAQQRGQIRSDLDALADDVDDDLGAAEDRLHHERSKLARRVAALEDEVGVTATDALATAEGGEDAHQLTKLGRLVRHGPEAVSDRPTERMRRAKELVENWSRWGTTRSDSLGKERRLASTKHDLKTRLEDARGESLAWRQVYRAMQLVEDWSGPNVSLEEGGSNEGKYVLVHTLQEGEG